MKKILFALLALPTISFAGTGANTSLVVSSGTFLGIDGYTNVTGNFRQAISVGASSMNYTMDVDASSSAKVNVAEFAGVALSASNPIPVQSTGATTVNGTVTSKLQDGSGNSITSTTNALDINIKSGSIANTAFTANAGTNLNTSLLALESGGNLATLSGGVSGSKYQMNNAQINGNAYQTNGSGIQLISCDIAGTSNTVVANAGTNLNTSSLALETGGNLATLAGGITSSVYQANLKNVGGNAVQTNGSGIQLISADIAGTSNTVTAVGAAANAASASGNPVRDGGDAHTALPSAVSDAQNVANFNDKFGRRVTIADCPRDLMVLSTMTLTSTTSELVFISSGGASVFNDIVNLIAINTSATAAELDFRSKGGPAGNATIDIPLYLPAGDTRGIAAGHVLTQQTANANWTVQSSASVASIKISAWYCSNK